MLLNVLLLSSVATDVGTMPVVLYQRFLYCLLFSLLLICFFVLMLTRTANSSSKRLFSMIIICRLDNSLHLDLSLGEGSGMLKVKVRISNTILPRLKQSSSFNLSYTSSHPHSFSLLAIHSLLLLTDACIYPQNPLTHSRFR